MNLRSHTVKRNEIPEYVEVVADSAVPARRYGSTLQQLGEAWSGLLDQQAVSVVGFEEDEEGVSRKVAVGVRVFVNDSFMTEMKKSPRCWVGPELVRRVLAGRSPILSDRELRVANTKGGLNLLVWESAVCARCSGKREIIHQLFEEFVERHRGFLLKELMAQSVSTDMLEAQLLSGGFLVDDNGQYTREPHRLLEEVVEAPHYVGVSRELAMETFGTWISSLFMHRPPRFGFRPGEQRLLMLAFSGATDVELSEELRVSLSSVKKCWQLIYERVSACDPTLFPGVHMDENGNGNGERGQTKKQRLLAYLREQMEELRPFG